MDGCEILLPFYGQHTAHLCGANHLSEEEAHQMVEERAQFGITIPQPVVGKKRARSTKSTQEALQIGACSAAGEEEEEEEGILAHTCH